MGVKPKENTQIRQQNSKIGFRTLKKHSQLSRTVLAGLKPQKTLRI
jgi:hypothetical protein